MKRKLLVKVKNSKIQHDSQDVCAEKLMEKDILKEGV